MSFLNKLIKPKEEKKKEKRARGKDKKRLAKEEEKEKSFFQSEGELAIDVYETEDEFIIQSTIAGVKAEDLDISVEDDLITIRGSREQQKKEEKGKYLYQECYWGAFSRQVILPEKIDSNRIEAKIKNGVLTLRLPKIQPKKKKKIIIKEEE